MKKAILILLFASLNVVVIESCADDDSGTTRDFLDNDASDPDRSLDNDGDSFQDMDLNDADGSLDSDRDFLDNDANDPDRSLDNDGDSFQDMDLNDADRSLDSDDGGLDNDMSDPDRGLDTDDTRDSDSVQTVSP